MCTVYFHSSQLRVSTVYSATDMKFSQFFTNIPFDIESNINDVTSIIQVSFENKLAPSCEAWICHKKVKCNEVSQLQVVISVEIVFNIDGKWTHSILLQKFECEPKMWRVKLKGFLIKVNPRLLVYTKID